MTQQETLLWQRIQNFNLDNPDATFKFSTRLARENGWSVAYSKRVIEEYKKFIFLCCVSESGVTPSDPVDQAWHLHLTYTRSYWTDLCKNTLQKEIHHNPTKGGKTEADKFNTYYTSSHKLYIDKFGYAPPADIWHDNTTRFNDINFRRVNLNAYWLLRKPKISPKTLIAILVLVAACILIQAYGGLIIPAIAIAYVAFAYFRYGGNEPEAIPKKRKKEEATEQELEAEGCDSDDNDNNDADSSHHDSGDSGCSNGCSGCSSGGCSGCGGGGD